MKHHPISWLNYLPGFRAETWNPTVGCTPVSVGCRHCYAEELHDMRHHAYTRGKKMPQCYASSFSQVRCLPERLEKPLHWHEPRLVFVDSMSDLFHPAVPADYIQDVYDVMTRCLQHRFIICTKRPERIARVLYSDEDGWYMGGGDYLPNVWHLTTAEHQLALRDRVPHLLALRDYSDGWPVLGLSCEPLLGPVDLSPWLDQLNWVIVGGESGRDARPLYPLWVTAIEAQCARAGVPFFFKQWGEYAYAEIDRAATHPHLYCVDRDGHFTAASVGENTYIMAHDADDWSPAESIPEDWLSCLRVGKARAGRLLHGVEHNATPAS